MKLSSGNLNSFVFHWVCLFSMILTCSSCASPTNNSTNETANDRVWELSDIKVELSNYEGVELVNTNCVPCHSLHYIEMQPEMTKKEWERIITKMIFFGAPVKDSLTKNEIISYLMAIKGKK